MDKRYQVFISSTFKDLQEARQLASETVLDMRHMPVGMEQFPASPEEQFSYIKRIIDSSDYYILIIGGKYGSLSAEGISYTEMEYDYAVQENIPILAFIYENPEKIEGNKTGTDPALCNKLKSFRDKVKENNLASIWDKPETLPGKIMQSLNKAIENFPRAGWVRADNAGKGQVNSWDFKDWIKLAIGAIGGATVTYLVLTHDGQETA